MSRSWRIVAAFGLTLLSLNAVLLGALVWQTTQMRNALDQPRIVTVAQPRIEYTGTYGYGTQASGPATLDDVVSYLSDIKGVLTDTQTSIQDIWASMATSGDGPTLYRLVETICAKIPNDILTCDY